VQGQIFVSNYRIYFHAMDKVNSQHCDWSIPVHTVERFESLKTDGQTTQAIYMSMSTYGSQSEMIGRTMVLYCKDGQIRRFSTHRTFNEEQLLADEFHYFQRKFYTWSYCNEDTFARIHAKALEQIEPTPVPPEHSLQEVSDLIYIYRHDMRMYKIFRAQKPPTNCVQYDYYTPPPLTYSPSSAFDIFSL
jgi:hypothetical protein